MDLLINTGSSSVKFSGVRSDGQPIVVGHADRVADQVVLTLTEAGESVTIRTPEEALSPGVLGLLDAVVNWLSARALAPRAVVHRVVHGGARFVTPVVIDPTVRAELEALTVLAPLHQPINLAGIDRFGAAYPEAIAVACFDTAFHAGQSAFEQHFALPERLFAEGVRRYGFHGLSYAYLTRQLPAQGIDQAARVVLCHLGSGASLCAVHQGVSVASTMGLTALDGLPMGTRAGRLDAGVVLHLLAAGWDAAQITELVYRESGLLGLSGISADVRTLEASSDPRAAFALDYFAYRINAELGSLVAILGGLDAVVFSGGIGEHSAGVRARVLTQCARWLPLAWDPDANDRHQRGVSTSASRVRVLILPTDEAEQMRTSALPVIEAAARSR